MKTAVFGVRKVSSFLDKMAGACLFGVMALAVANIVLRTAFNRPILGTYELVGFLTAVGTGLALAQCALKDGQIAVTFFTERLPRKVRLGTEAVMNGAALIFWALVSYHLALFAASMMAKGLVSPSAEIPVYPFIYLIALGISALCVVLLLKLSLGLETLTGRAARPINWEMGLAGPEKRAAR